MFTARYARGGKGVGKPGAMHAAAPASRRLPPPLTQRRTVCRRPLSLPLAHSTHRPPTSCWVKWRCRAWPPQSSTSASACCCSTRVRRRTPLRVPPTQLLARERAPLMLIHALPSPAPPALPCGAALRPEAASGVAAETQALVQTCVGFVAAWTGACWFAYGAGILWLFRTGVMQP